MQHYDSTRQFYQAASAGRVFQWLKDQIRQIPEAQPGVENTGTSPPDAQIAEKHDD